MSQPNQSDILNAATQQGWIEIQAGVYVNSLANILAEQAGWDDHDEMKSIDFTRAPYWLTTDSGDIPVPVRSPSDLPDTVFERLVRGGGVAVDRGFL